MWWARFASELQKMTSFLISKDRVKGPESFTSKWLGVSSSRQDGSPSYAAVVRGVDDSVVKHAGMQRSIDEPSGLDLLPESCSRVVNEGRRAVNCFDLEEQPHGSPENSSSHGLPLDPLDKGLSLRPPGKKKIHCAHSTRGVSSLLNLKLYGWIHKLVSSTWALGRFAGFGLGPKCKGFRLGRFLQKPYLRHIFRAPFQSVISEDEGPVSTADLGHSSQPELSSPTVYGLVTGRQGQNDPSTADRGRFSQRETSSPSVSGMISGLSPIPVSASLPSCSNLVVLSQEDTVEPSLPFSFPPSLVAQTSSANPLVGFGFFGGHGLDAATVPCGSGFVPPPLTGAAEMGERIRSSLPLLQPFKPFQFITEKLGISGKVK